MDDCVGSAVEERIASMGAGDVMLLENVRFHAGEEVSVFSLWLLVLIVLSRASFSWPIPPDPACLLESSTDNVPV